MTTSPETTPLTPAQLFSAARTHNAWQDRPVAPELLRELHERLKWAPTAMNCGPLRVRFIVSAEARAVLLPLMAEGNRAKTAAAPVVAVLGADLDFPATMGRLAPHVSAAAFAGQPAKVEHMARFNATLQTGYFILAARSLGLDCGPMTGFDNAKVDEAFFAGTPIRSNILVNLGHGDPASIFPRSPRLGFDEACRIA